MLALDDLPSLALFARVVHFRSFSAAAREAGIAKSVVSRRIANLENVLGVRLLRRTTRTLSVTEEGLRVYEECTRLLAAAGAAEEAAGREGAPRGTLRLSAPVTFARTHLVSALSVFLRDFPEIDIDLSTDNRLVDLVEGGFDVVVRMGRLADSTYYARKFATDRLVVCGAPAYLRKAGVPSAPADLLEHDCLHYSLVPRAGEWRFGGRDAKPVLPVRTNFAADDADLLREAALAGLGLVVVPSFVVKGDVDAGRLNLVLEGARRAEIGIYTVTAHRTHAPARVRVFLDFVRKHFARWGATEVVARS